MLNQKKKFIKLKKSLLLTKMKRILILLAFFATISVFAQNVPQGINYQATARAADGSALSNSNVIVRLSILDGNSQIWVETHQISTDPFGHFTFVIGNGTKTGGSATNFSDINWGANALSLKTELQIGTSGSFSDFGTTQLLSVPYSLYAKNAAIADEVNSIDISKVEGIDVTGATTGQVLIYDGTKWKASTLPSNTVNTSNRLKGDGSSSNPLDLNDMGATNGQALIYDGNTWAPTPLPSTTVNTATRLKGDGSITNPLDFNDMGATNGQALIYNGTNWAPTTLPSTTINTATRLKGDGSTTNPLDLNDMGAITGQVLKFNGTTWVPDTDLAGGGSITAGNGISISNGIITNTSPNENHTGDATGSTALTIVALRNRTISSTAPTNNQVYSWNATASEWQPRTLTNPTYTKGDISGQDSLTVIKIQGRNINSVAPTNNQVLSWDSANNRWTARSLSSSTPSYSSGDVTGTTSLSVVGLRNIPIAITAPTNNQVLQYDSINKVWRPRTLQTSNTLKAGNGIIVRNDSIIGNQWTNLANGSIFRLNRVGIGTNAIDPQTKLHVQSSNSTAGLFTSDSGSNLTAALWGEYNGTTNANAIGVFGNSRPSGGFGIGGFFEGGNIGVRAYNDGARVNQDYFGLFASSTGATNSNFRYGVVGVADSAAGQIGVSGEAVGQFYTGGINVGVRGIGDGLTTNYGVFGVANNTTATTNYAVYGLAASTTSNYAGYFSGNVAVTGSISKGSGTFKIDHPQDPENKFLIHSFVESPDMMNIYNGNITTDAKGFATVTLPDYFDALNREFRYQLTVMGTFAQAIIKEKIAGNKFVIQTNQPNVEVSWQVTGVRKDPYANANRVVDVVEKSAEEKGKYLHPELYGKPSKLGIGYPTDERILTPNNPYQGLIRK